MADDNSQMGIEGFFGIHNVFVDTFVHALDAKKRLTIPSEWRSLVGSPERLFVLPSTVAPCLNVYPVRTMAEKLKGMPKISAADSEGQDRLREISANANLLPWDAQGRIRIKDNLLEYAGLESEVVMVGMFERFELWSPKSWKQKQSVIDQQKLGMAVRSVGL
jgi:MraZ protein